MESDLREAGGATTSMQVWSHVKGGEMERKRVDRSILDGYARPLRKAGGGSRANVTCQRVPMSPRKEPPLVCLLHSAPGWEPPRGGVTPAQTRGWIPELGG